MTNYLQNGGFEGGWVHPGGVPELQIPEGWTFTWSEADDQNPYDPNPWAVFVRPEVRVLSRPFLPPSEHPLFIWEGDQCLKVFKGSGSLRFTLSQTLALPEGVYRLSAPVYPDLVKEYGAGGEKVWANDPAGRDGQARPVVGGVVPEWWARLIPGQRNNLTFEVTGTGAPLTVGVEFLLPFPLAQNGIFADDWRLEKLDGVEPPPHPSPPPPPPAVSLPPGLYTVNAGGNLRTAARRGTDTLIGWLPAGAEVEVLGVVIGEKVDGRDDWAEIKAQVEVQEGDIGTIKAYLWQVDKLTPVASAATDPGAYEIVDVTDALPRHETKRYGARPLSDITTLVIHHTAGSAMARPEDIASFHVNTRDWPGISYHYLIRGDGTIYQTQRPETVSWHCFNNNGYTLGVCLAGDFTHERPPQEQLDAARWLVAKLKADLGGASVRRHGEMPDNKTACPGATWAEWFPFVGLTLNG